MVTFTSSLDKTVLLGNRSYFTLFYMLKPGWAEVMMQAKGTGIIYEVIIAYFCLKHKSFWH